MTEPTTAEYEAQVTAKWQIELVRRLRAGEPMTKTDKAEAQKLIKKGA